MSTSHGRRIYQRKLVFPRVSPLKKPIKILEEEWAKWKNWMQEKQKSESWYLLVPDLQTDCMETPRSSGHDHYIHLQSVRIRYNFVLSNLISRLHSRAGGLPPWMRTCWLVHQPYSYRRGRKSFEQMSPSLSQIGNEKLHLEFVFLNPATSFENIIYLSCPNVWVGSEWITTNLDSDFLNTRVTWGI